MIVTIVKVYNLILFGVCIQMWNRHHDQDKGHVHHVYHPLVASVTLWILPYPCLQAATVCFLSLQINLKFQENCTNEIRQYVLTFACLFSLRIIILGFIHIFVCINHPFFILLHSVIQIYEDLFVHSYVDEFLDHFPHLLITNKILITFIKPLCMDTSFHFSWVNI